MSWERLTFAVPSTGGEAHGVYYDSGDDGSDGGDQGEGGEGGEESLTGARPRRRVPLVGNEREESRQVLTD